jgi:hypothetical protein
MILVLLAIGPLGCSDSDDPTGALPPSRAVNGTFSGAMPVEPPGEDWSRVTMDLVTDRGVSGTLKPLVGIDHAIGGTFAGNNLILRVGDLPGDSTCIEIALNIFRFELNSSNEVTAFEGTLSGRCQGTVSGSFRMERQ